MPRVSKIFALVGSVSRFIVIIKVVLSSILDGSRFHQWCFHLPLWYNFRDFHRNSIANCNSLSGHTDQGPYKGCGQDDGQGMYWGMSTASEVFLIFTTQLFSYLCDYNAIFSTY